MLKKLTTVRSLIAAVVCTVVAALGSVAQAQTSVYDTVDVEGTIDGLAGDLANGIIAGLTIGAGVLLVAMVWKFGKRYIRG